MIAQAFNEAGKKPEGPSGNDFVEAILRERPDLQGKPVRLFGEQGYCSHTITIGNEIFKRPHSAPPFSYMFDQELKVLQGMAGKGLPVPEVTYVGKEMPFFGMKVLPGAQLGQGFFERQPEEVQLQLAKDIAKFAVDFAAAFPVKENGMFMIHGDMNLGNFLIDPKTKRLSGVVDFGMASYMDETGAVKARGITIKDPGEWLPHVRGGSEEFNEMVYEEYRALRQAQLLKPSARTSERRQP